MHVNLCVRSYHTVSVSIIREGMGESNSKLQGIFDRIASIPLTRKYFRNYNHEQICKNADEDSTFFGKSKRAGEGGRPVPVRKMEDHFRVAD